MAGINPKWIIGKTVAKIQTQRIKPTDGSNFEDTEFQAIEFTDGSRLQFVSLEQSYEAGYVHANYIPKGK